MHDEIIRFSMSGEMTDSNLESHKAQLVDFLETRMREEGAVPSLDLDPGFTLDYDHDRDTFKFTLSVYGIYVGKDDQLWQVAGMTSGRTVMKYTPPTRSKAS